MKRVKNSTEQHPDSIMGKPSGLRTTAYTDRAWSRAGLGAQAAFYQAMTAGLPAGTMLEVKLHRAGWITSLNYEYADPAAPDERFFTFQREFSKAARHVNHCNDRVAPALQGQGISKTVSRHMFNFYKERSVESATLLACDTGVFAHTRPAFYPEDRSDLLHLDNYIGGMLDLLEAHPCPVSGRLPAHYTGTLRRWNEDMEGKNFWFITDQAYQYHGMPLGKLLTIDHENLPASFLDRAGGKLPNHRNKMWWSGRLDMKDPDCTSRADAYLTGKGEMKAYSVAVARRLGLGAADIAAFMNVRQAPQSAPRRRAQSAPRAAAFAP